MLPKQNYHESLSFCGHVAELQITSPKPVSTAYTVIWSLKIRVLQSSQYIKWQNTLMENYGWEETVIHITKIGIFTKNKEWSICGMTFSEPCPLSEPEPCPLLSRVCLCLQHGRSLVCQPRTNLKALCCSLVFLRKKPCNWSSLKKTVIIHWL